MGERLDRALKMSLDEVVRTLETWRLMGCSKLTILGGEPTLHPDYIQIIRAANDLGYEHVITTSNGLEPAIRKFRQMSPADFAYVQISLDGGCPDSHDRIRGPGTFDEALRSIAELVREKTIEGISDIRDESDRSGMSIVIDLKRGDVGASDEQHEQRRHAERGEPAARRADEAFPQGLEARRDVRVVVGVQPLELRRHPVHVALRARDGHARLERGEHLEPAIASPFREVVARERYPQL